MPGDMAFEVVLDPLSGQVKGLLFLGRVLAADNQPLHHGHAMQCSTRGLEGGVFSIKVVP